MNSRVTQASIVSNEQLIATKISASLADCGVASSQQALTMDLGKSLARLRETGAAMVVFLCSRTFSRDDLLILKQGCAVRSPQLKIVAVGPMRDPNLMLEVMRSGPSDYLDIDHVDLHSEISAIVERLNTVEPTASQPGKLFTVLGAVGGVGTSLVASNLAAVFASKFQSCALLDLHLRGGSLSQILNVKPEYTLASLAGKGAQIDEQMFQGSLVKHECGVRLLASPPAFSDYRQFSSQMMQQVLALARRNFRSVVVDLEDTEHSEQVRTLAASDRIIVIARPDFVAVSRTKSCLEYLAKAKVPREQITLVLNRVGQPRELAKAAVAEALGFQVDHCIADDPGAVNASYNLGSPLVLSQPKCSAALAIIHLASSLAGETQDPRQSGASGIGQRVRHAFKWLETSKPPKSDEKKVIVETT